jgi:Translation initiation factor IF-2, N-terminal region
LKIRVFALANELNIDPDLLVRYCNEIGIPVKNLQASISPKQRKRVTAFVRSKSKNPQSQSPSIRSSEKYGSGMKLRVFALAKELDIDSKMLIEYFAEIGIPVKNVLASVTPEERDRVVAYLRSKSQQTEVAVSPTESVEPAHIGPEGADVPVADCMPLVVYVDPGAASAEVISKLFLVMSALYESEGGPGLQIVSHETGVLVGEEVPV